MTAKPDSNRIQKLLKNFTKEKFVGMSGLALLCGATVFALSGDPGAALLGSVGSNVLAAVLQQHFEKVRDLPNADEQERLAVFARSLTPEISNNKELQEAVGAFVDANHTFDIALALVDENPQVHGWLLTKIYSDVRAYRHDFDRIHDKLDQVMMRLEKPDVQEENEALRAYLKMIVRRFDRLPLAPLDPGGGERVDISLDDVFVSLEVAESLVYEQVKIGKVTWIGVSKTALAFLHHFERTILLGEAGSGKSTLLRHLAYCLANAFLEQKPDWLMRLSWQKGYISNERGENLTDFSSWLASRSDDNRPSPVELFWSVLDLIPVMVELREFVRTSFEPNSPQALWRYIESTLINEEMADVIPALKRKAQQGKLLLLFDGVDEVANEKRANVWRAIAALRNGPYGGCRWISTCRILSFVAEEAPAGVPAQTIQPLNQNQIDLFVQKWTEALRGRGELTLDEAVTFQNNLQDATRDRLRELAPNPMLLTIIVLVQKYHGTLPKERAKLYDACVETMMLRWQQHKEKADGKEEPAILSQLGISKEDFERLLWELAWQAHSKNSDVEGTADIAEADILRVARKPGFFNNDLERIGKFINYTKERAHLLSYKGGIEEPLYTFPHRTFQEYLAARSLLVNRRLDRIIGDLAGAGAPWREVMNLAAGILVYNENNREAAIGLVETVLPLETPNETEGWHRVWLAGEMATVVGRAWMELDEVGRELLPGLCEQLANLLKFGVLTPQQRAEAGTALGILGEIRPDVVCDVPEMVDVPAGPFLMGSIQEKDEQAYDDEMPQHELTLPAYRIGKYPVTNVQFTFFTQAGGYENEAYWTKAGWAERKKQNWTEPRYSDNPRYNQANQPVVGVSWYEAVAYCNWLKVTTGREFRLPDEAMWEKAARGTQGQIYPWGNTWLPENLNSSESNINRPSAVGIFPDGKSPYKAYDMCGNVWEWCSTVYEKYPFKERPYRAEIEAGNSRCLRGGAFDFNRRFSRAAFRDNYNPDYRNLSIGFRVAEHLSISGS